MLVSIVIPVYNMWPLTRDCLFSLAQHTTCEQVEVIVVDNASHDATQQECPALGTALFGPRFQYLRQSCNTNFAPACNTGARAAQGEFVFFLNNDTLACPNWLAPLVRCMESRPNLGAVGPLLLYPAFGPYADRVQHLGITVNHSLKVAHLYEGFPANHPVVRQKRLLQAITGAALLIRRTLFLHLGGFDERFINDCEDIDLCIRIRQAGFELTCEPASRMYHLASQTPERHNSHAINHTLSAERIAPHLYPDMHFFARSDGYEYRFTPWLRARADLSHAASSVLARKLQGKPQAATVEALIDAEPLWHQGYFWLAENAVREAKPDAAIALMQLLVKQSPDFESLEKLMLYAGANGQHAVAEGAANTIRNLLAPAPDYAAHAQTLLLWLCDIGLEELAPQVTQWQAQQKTIHAVHMLPLVTRLHSYGLLGESIAASYGLA